MSNEVSSLIVFTDLDGTLLNHNDYSYEAALPAIERLNSLHIPLIFVSSKTIVEVRALRVLLGIDWPYVCENGSLIVMPNKYRYLSQAFPVQSIRENDEHVFCFGTLRENILIILEALHSEYNFRSFSEMPNEEIAERTGLSVDQASLANIRSASEPIVWQDSLDHFDGFVKRLLKCNCRVVKGGRFYHIMGDTDKAEAVVAITNAYERFHEIVAHSIILGDSENDCAMLRSATTAIVMPKIDGSTMRMDDIASVIYAKQHGPAGWRECIEALLKKLT